MSFSRFSSLSGAPRNRYSGSSHSNSTSAGLRYSQPQPRFTSGSSSILFGGGQEPDYQHMFSQIAQITEQLFLSSAHPVTVDRLRKLGITFVVNATMDVPCVRGGGIDSMQVMVDDTPFAQLRTYFDRVADRIHHEVRRGGKVLIHCVAGVSRSSTLTMVYLMKYRNMTLRQAHDHVKSRRPYIRPNNGFWRQLIEYEEKIFGTNSVKLFNSTMGMVPDIYNEEMGGGFMWFPAAAPPRRSPPSSSLSNSPQYETSYRSSYSRNF